MDSQKVPLSFVDGPLKLIFLEQGSIYLNSFTCFVQAFGEYDMWLAAENGMYLRHTHGEWDATLEHKLDMDWVESVQVTILYWLRLRLM